MSGIVALCLVALAPGWHWDDSRYRGQHPYPYRYGYELIDGTFEPRTSTPRWHDFPDGKRGYGTADSDGRFVPILAPSWTAFAWPWS